MAEKKKIPFWITYIKNRIKNKKNFLCVITGATGSGKSWSGVTICSYFRRYYIVTNARQLLKLINEGILKSGDAILWDEAGIGLGNRDWQSVRHRLINYLLQTFRHKRLILIMTSPSQDFLDAQSRKLFHAEFITQRIDYTKREVILKPLLIQYNSRFKKYYHKFLRVQTPRGLAVLKKWRVPAPTPEQIKHYEDIKTEFTTKLNLSIEKELNKIEEVNNLDRKKRLTEKQETAMRLMAKYKNAQKVSEEMGIVKQVVYQHLEYAERKGWKVEDFKEIKGETPTKQLNKAEKGIKTLTK